MLKYLIIFALLPTASARAEELAGDLPGWQMNYAFQTKGSGLALSPSGSGFVFSFPMSGSKTNPSIPYLTGQWAGYLTYTKLIKKVISALTLVNGQSVVVTGNITTSAPSVVFNWQSEPQNTCPGAPAAFHPYIQSVSGNHWWGHAQSGNAFVPLTAGPFAIVIPVVSSAWSNEDGHFAGEYDAVSGTYPYLAAWQRDIASVYGIGGTFGGGCFFGHGVNVSGGTATFQVLSFQIL